MTARGHPVPSTPYISVMRPHVIVLGLLLGACASASGATPPPTFMQSTAEARNTRIVDVREGFSRANAMRALVEALGQHYTVEITDPKAGFAMTAWNASLMRDGVPDLRYRTRFVAQFMGDDWRKLQIRHEANWARGQEWEVGYDAAQLDSVGAEMRTRLGKRP